MQKIDTIDRRIVQLLIGDGRLSSTEIARQLGDVSQRVVRYRLDRLLREGIIRVGAIVSPEALGYEVIADVFVEVEPGRVMEVARHLMEYDCLSYIACSTGDRDISMQVVARDNTELYQFVTEVVGNVPGVRRTSTMLVPVVLKDVYQWHIPASACTDHT